MKFITQPALLDMPLCLVKTKKPIEYTNFEVFKGTTVFKCLT